MTTGPSHARQDGSSGDLWGATKNDASDRMFPLAAGVRSVLATQKAMQDSGLTGAPPALLIVDGIRRGPLVFTALDGGPLASQLASGGGQGAPAEGPERPI